MLIIRSIVQPYPVTFMSEPLSQGCDTTLRLFTIVWHFYFHHRPLAHLEVYMSSRWFTHFIVPTYITRRPEVGSEPSQCEFTAVAQATRHQIASPHFPQELLPPCYCNMVDKNAAVAVFQRLTTRSYGVTASTLDSESSDRGSNPRRTCLHDEHCTLRELT